MISGTVKGHKLKTVKGDTTRPTSDRVKESLFNIIAPCIQGSDVLDLFAGTGSLGIEALSRGAHSAVFVDKGRECLAVMTENLQHTRFLDKAKVLTGDVSSMVYRLSTEGKKFDIIFMDPPYGKKLIEDTLIHILNGDIMKKDGIIIAERDVDDHVPETMGTLTLIRNQRYGDTVISFYKQSMSGQEGTDN